MPPTQAPLQQCLSFLHFFPLGLQRSSAEASPMPSDPSVPPTRAAPISLSALPREMLPLASPIASSSKERSVVSGDIGSPFHKKGGTRGSPAVSINAFSVKGWKGWRNFGEKFCELRLYADPRGSPYTISRKGGQHLASSPKPPQTSFIWGGAGLRLVLRWWL